MPWKNNGSISIGIHFKARLKGTLWENRKTLSKPIHSAKSTNMWGHYCYLRGSPGNLYCYRKCMGHYCMKIATLQSVISSYHMYTLCQHSCCAGYNCFRLWSFSHASVFSLFLWSFQWRLTLAHVQFLIFTYLS